MFDVQCSSAVERGCAESQPQQRSQFNGAKAIRKDLGLATPLRLVSDTAALRPIGRKQPDCYVEGGSLGFPTNAASLSSAAVLSAVLADEASGEGGGVCPRDEFARHSSG